jgi:Ca2+-binding RTX toxin-like protein
MVPDSGNPIIDAVSINKYSWNTQAHTSLSLTYSFMSSVPAGANADDSLGFVAMNDVQKQGARAALALWSTVANVTFTEVASNGKMQFGTNDQGDVSAAYAYYPYPSKYSGVFLNNQESSNSSFGAGSYGLMTMIHEIGHSLGLKHPGNYNAGGGGTDGPYLPEATDNTDYTLMSYHTGAMGKLAYQYSSTPMMYDILAIQYLYGANTSYHAGNDVYRLSDKNVPMCIWDGGGYNTLDMSACTGATIVNLNEGSFSETNKGYNNVSIAFGVTMQAGRAGQGGSIVIGNSVDNVLSGGNGVDSLDGGAGNDNLHAGLGNDNLVGGLGNDTLDGEAGNDTMAGGAGDDEYWVDSATDVVQESAGNGTDLVRASLANYTLAEGVENLTFQNLSTGYVGTGNGANNIIRGGANNDLLSGGAGNDTLIGNGGEDTLDGGAGDGDVVQFAAPLAQYSWLKLNATDIRFTANGVSTIVRGVEVISFAGESKTLGELGIGPASAGPDNLTGTEGDDLIDGKGGADTMHGLGGNDSYAIDNLGDRIDEASDGGIDKALVGLATAGQTYVLDTNVENAAITSTVAINVTGNGLDNQLTGNDAANVLDGLDGNDQLLGGGGADKLLGGAGNDTLVGGSGNDTMDGGAGDDVYDVDAATDQVIELDGGGIDRVETALASLTLAANVEQLVYTGKASFNGSGNAGDNLIVGGSGADTLSGLAGDDSLHGGAGNDSLLGGDGNDELFGDGGKDTLDGGAGDDTAYMARSIEHYTLSRPNATDLLVTDKDSGEVLTLRNVEKLDFAGSRVVVSELLKGIVSPGNDVLPGTSGNDTIDGLTGADTMSGLAGDDSYVVDNVGDQVVEQRGEGNDTVTVTIAVANSSYVLADNVENGKLMGTVALNLSGNAADNQLTGNDAANVLNGLDGNDKLLGGAGADKLLGGSGDDTLLGGSGNDTMEGGAGNDVYDVDATTDQVIELDGGGNDRVETALASLTLAANVEQLVYTGKASFNGSGNAGDNLLVGGSGNDSLNGLAGNDALHGGAGNDSLLGGDGNDALFGEGGKDTLDGGAGDDTVYLARSLDHYTVARPNATDLVVTDKDSGEVSTLRNVEHIDFAGQTLAYTDLIVGVVSAGNDSLPGTNGNDNINGLTGADTMVGLAGDDLYTVDNVGDVVVEQAGQGNDTVNVAIAVANNSYVLADNVENAKLVATVAANLTGNGADNQLTGNEAANVLSGLDGNDSLFGNGGADRLLGGAGNDNLDGGSGNDTLDGGSGNDSYVVDSVADVIIEADGGGKDAMRTAASAMTQALNVESMYYTGNAAFAGTGNVQNNLLGGSYGNDTLSGLAGDDILLGGGGNDSLLGGDGNDNLYGDEGKNTLDGGAGDDTAHLARSADHYTVTRPNAIDVVLTDKDSGDSTVLRNVEHVDFAGQAVLDYADLIVGVVSVGNDLLPGTNGNDNINGLAGADTMIGLGGDDQYTVDNIGDVVTEQAGQGFDLVNVAIATAGVTYVLGDHVEQASVTSTAAVNLQGNGSNNVLLGNAASNVLLGLDGDDRLEGLAGNDKLDGGAGNDTLVGGVGSDTMIGGLGDDSYVVDAAGDQVVEADGGGHDSVVASVASYTLAANVETLSAAAQAGNFSFTGNALDNLITGYNGNDILLGGAGNDTLSGLAGNDNLQGGDGDDLLLGGSGNDTLDGGLGDDTVQLAHDFASYTRSRPSASDLKLVDQITGDTIVLRNVEHIDFHGTNLSWNDAVFNLVSLGNDTLVGSSGADTLNGLAGADVMTGLGGDDVYVVDVQEDSVVEAAAGGSDTVQLAISKAGTTYVLASNVEHATVTSTVALNVTGNDGHNALTGNALNNVLDGQAGNDTLDGGAGNDTLLGGDGNDQLQGGAGNDSMAGGAGDDVYYVDVASDIVSEADNAGIDRVETKAASYVLTANVEHLLYTGSAAFTGTGNALDNRIEGGSGADKLMGGDGNDILIGGLGNDTVSGGSGLDQFVLRTGGGVDTVTDFVSGSDTLRIDVTAAAVGNGDAVLDHALLVSGAGSFDTTAELVIIERNAAALTADKAALAIGSASSAYAVGASAIFAIDNGVSTALFRFVSNGNDAQVSAAELTQIAVLTGVPSTALPDYLFG